MNYINSDTGDNTFYPIFAWQNISLDIDTDIAPPHHIMSITLKWKQK